MKLTHEELQEYMRQMKDNELNRRSFNERQRLWNDYIKRVRGGRTETSFDMNRFQRQT